jgi:flagellin
MALRFDKKVPALNASELSNRSGQVSIQALERLSSALRVHRAADDAQGLGIAVDFTSHVRGAQTPQRVAREGVSLVQTAESHTASRSGIEGSLNEATTILQRVGALAVQASNDTQDTNNRTAIDGKMSRLLGPFDAYQNRSEFTIDTLAIQQENSTAAESAIRDAGIAVDTIAFTCNEILPSAGSSVWAQANVTPRTALSLPG